MSSSDDSAQAATEITLVTGDRHRVEGSAKEVEQRILDAARGSIMEFAWFIDADTGAGLAVNPEYVVLLQDAAPGAGADYAPG